MITAMMAKVALSILDDNVFAEKREDLGRHPYFPKTNSRAGSLPDRLIASKGSFLTSMRLRRKKGMSGSTTPKMRMPPNPAAHELFLGKNRIIVAAIASGPITGPPVLSLASMKAGTRGISNEI
jgi:hypothetical protein